MLERSKQNLKNDICLPSRVPTLGHIYLRYNPHCCLLHLRQAGFVRGVLALEDNALPRALFIYRSNESKPPASSLIHSYKHVLDTLSLPSIEELIHATPSKSAWKALTKTITHEKFQNASPAHLCLPSPMLLD